MNPEEFALHYHELRFDNACHEKTGMEFQTFFEKIMVKHDPTFVAIKPSGREGDWKADGFSQNRGAVFQAYAPEEMTNAKAASKIATDFNGAKNKWGNKMKEWVFVWSSHDSLPPHAVDILQNLKQSERTVLISDLSRKGLWDIVVALPLLDRVELLGAVPSIDPTTEPTAVEIQALLHYLVRQEAPRLPDNLDLTDLAEKINRNRLSSRVREQVQRAISTVQVVEKYVKRHYDVQYSQLVANVLAYKYQQFVSIHNQPDDIFFALVEYTRGSDQSPTNYWPAVAIIAYYFQLCDIFER